MQLLHCFDMVANDGRVFETYSYSTRKDAEDKRDALWNDSRVENGQAMLTAITTKPVFDKNDVKPS